MLFMVQLTGHSNSNETYQEGIALGVQNALILKKGLF